LPPSGTENWTCSGTHRYGPLGMKSEALHPSLFCPVSSRCPGLCPCFCPILCPNHGFGLGLGYIPELLVVWMWIEWFTRSLRRIGIDRMKWMGCYLVIGLGRRMVWHGTARHGRQRRYRLGHREWRLNGITGDTPAYRPSGLFVFVLFSSGFLSISTGFSFPSSA
jgi:hypothetical protein